MIVSIANSHFATLVLGTAPMTIDAFKSSLIRIREATDPSKMHQMQPFNTLKQALLQLLIEAEKSEEIRNTCPEYVFSDNWSVHSRRDIHSWVSRLLAKLEDGQSLPPSQHDALLSHYLSELPEEAAKMVSRSARRVSDAPAANKKKK